MAPLAFAFGTLFDIDYRPVNMTMEELRDGFHKLAVDLVSKELTN